LPLRNINGHMDGQADSYILTKKLCSCMGNKCNLREIVNSTYNGRESRHTVSE